MFQIRKLHIEKRRKNNETPVPNKPVAIMAADVKTQASVLRKNYGDYPQYSLLETATIAIGKPLQVMQSM